MKQTFLGERFFVLFCSLALVGVGSVQWAPLLPLLLVGLVALVAAAAADFPRGLTRSALAAGARLSHAPVLGEDFTVTLSVTPKGEGPAPFSRLRFVAWRLGSVRFAQEVVASERGAGQVVGAVLQAHAQALGYERLTRLVVRADSRLRLWSTRLELELEPLEFRVMPREADISSDVYQQLVSGQRALFTGNRRVLRSGGSEQYRTARPFEYGDELRHIDQKKTAKLGRPMTRVYEALHQHHLVIALDVGRGLSGEIEGSSRHDFYLSAALALIRTALKSRDRVSFLAFDRQVRHVIAGAREGRAFYPLFTNSVGLFARNEETDFDVLASEVGRLSPSRAIVVVLTDVARASSRDALLARLPDLCRKHLVFVLSLRGQELALEPAVADYRPGTLDLETYNRFLYRYAIGEELERAKERLSQLGVGLIVTSEHDWIGAATRLYQMARDSLRL